MRPLLPTRGAPRSRRCLVHGGRPLRTVSQAVSLWMNHTVCARLPDIRTSAKSHNYVFSLDLEYLERSRGCRTTVVRVIRKHGRILSRCTSPIFAHWRSSNGGGNVDDRLFPARRERNRRDGLCLRRDRMRHGSRSGELLPGSSTTIGGSPSSGVDESTSGKISDSGPRSADGGATEAADSTAGETRYHGDASSDAGETNSDTIDATDRSDIGTSEETGAVATEAQHCDCFVDGTCLSHGQRYPTDSCDVCVAETGALASAEDGAECASQSMCTTGSCTEVRRVFATRAMFDVNAILGGRQVDSLCQEAGRNVDENAAWLAWFAGGEVSPPSERFERFTGPYVTVQGTTIADGWTSLVSTDFSGRTLSSTIDVDERGQPIRGATVQGQEIPPIAWTGVEQDGTDAYDNCGDWTFTSTGRFVGTFGDLSATDARWTRGGTQDCTEAAHLYCFEQSAQP